MREELRKLVCESLFNYLEEQAFKELADHILKGDYHRMWQLFENLDLLLRVKERVCRR